MNISVAMATYNGEKYLNEQLDSILIQLNYNDEIVISDDGSIDSTISIIKHYQKVEKRIKLYKGPQKGFVKNFENAINHCTNEIIFLSDQDDIWLSNKRNEVLNCFKEDNIDLVIHNFVLLIDGKILPSNYVYHQGIMHNLIMSSYIGCMMAFRKTLLGDNFTFPQGLMAHDQWIGLLGEKKRSSYYCNEILVKYRRHFKVQTKKMNLRNKILFRIKMFCLYENNLRKV